MRIVIGLRINNIIQKKQWLQTILKTSFQDIMSWFKIRVNSLVILSTWFPRHFSLCRPGEVICLPLIQYKILNIWTSLLNYMSQGLCFKHSSKDILLSFFAFFDHLNIEVWLVYNVILASCIQLSDLAMCIYIYFFPDSFPS